MNCEETESVNDEIQSQEFFDKGIQENVLRGEKLIGKAKKTIQTIVLADLFIFVTGILTLGSDSNFFDKPVLCCIPPPISTHILHAVFDNLNLL